MILRIKNTPFRQVCFCFIRCSAAAALFIIACRPGRLDSFFTFYSGSAAAIVFASSMEDTPCQIFPFGPYSVFPANLYVPPAE